MGLSIPRRQQFIFFLIQDMFYRAPEVSKRVKHVVLYLLDRDRSTGHHPRRGSGEGRRIPAEIHQALASSEARDPSEEGLEHIAQVIVESWLGTNIESGSCPSSRT